MKVLWHCSSKTNLPKSVLPLSNEMALVRQDSQEVKDEAKVSLNFATFCSGFMFLITVMLSTSKKDLVADRTDWLAKLQIMPGLSSKGRTWFGKSFMLEHMGAPSWMEVCPRPRRSTPFH